MNVRRWLQHLDKLRHRARTSFLHALFRTKLCRRRVTAPPDAGRPISGAGADLRLSGLGRIFRLLCSDTVELTPAYPDWVAMLAQLPADATPAQIMSVLTSFSGDRATEGVMKVRFSWQRYMQSLPAALSQATEFVQFGHAMRQPALNLLSVLSATEAPQELKASSAVLLIHCQSQQREPSG